MIGIVLWITGVLILAVGALLLFANILAQINRALPQ